MYKTKSNIKNINKLITKVKIYLKLSFLFKGIYNILLFFGIVFVIFSLLDRFFSFSYLFRKYFSVIFIFVLLYLLVKYIILSLLKVYSKKDEVCLIIQQNYPFLKDDLINAFQLIPIINKNIFSSILIQSLIERVNRNLSRIRIKNFIDKKGVFIKLLNLIVFYFLILFIPFSRASFTRLFFFLKSEPSVLFKHILPGNTSIIKGENQRIELIPATFINDKVYILFRNVYKKEKSKWKKERMYKENDKYIYDIENINNKIEYFIQIRDIQSKHFFITLFSLPNIGSVSMVYIYPSYTGLKPERFKNKLDIEALLGTKILMKCKTNVQLKKAKLITSTGKEFPLKIDNLTLKGQFVIQENEEYWIELEDCNGHTNLNPIKNRIVVIEDKSPYIEILFPNRDITISKSETLPIVYKVEDDIGIKNITMIYNYDGKQHKIEIESFKTNIKSIQDKFEFNLRLYSFLPGKIISYYFQVVDNDTISGPKSRFSKRYMLEIFSYTKRHNDIEKKQKEISDMIIKILAEQIENKTRVESKMDLGSIKENQSGISKKTKEVLDRFNTLLKDMKTDPLTSEFTYEEYKSMFRGIKWIKDNKMDYLDSLSFEENNRETIKSIQQDIIDDFERYSLLSDDIFRRQKMDNIFSSTDELLDTTTNLNEYLKDFSKEDKQKIKELENILNEISSLMRQIISILTDYPNELPQEFINKDALENLELSKIQNIFEKLKKSVDENNIDEAITLAKRFAESLSKLKQELNLLSENVDMFSSVNEMINLVNSIKEFIQKETDIKEKTFIWERKRQERLFSQQERKLKRLKKIQNTISNEILNLHIQQKEELLRKIQYKTNKIREDFSNNRFEQMDNKLNNLVRDLRRLGNEISLLKLNNKKELMKKIKRIYTKEIAVKDEFNRNIPSGKLFTIKEKQKIKDIIPPQTALINEVDRFIVEYKLLASKTSLLPLLEGLENLNTSKYAMEKVNNNLEKYKTVQALNEEEEAIFYLNKLKGIIEGSYKKLSALKEEKMPFGKKKSMLPIGVGIGFREGYVDIPKKEDFKPIYNLKKEIIKALKETYPEKFKKVIRAYYEKLYQ